MLGDGRLVHRQPGHQLVHRALAVPHEVENLPPPGLRQHFKYRGHLPSMPNRAYSCQGIFPVTHPPAERALSAATSAGITSPRSPTTASSACARIGAPGSVLTTTMCLAPAQPAMCWMAPLIPQARYSSGVIFVPVCPTCWRCGRQPSLVTTRETPTTPPSRPASSSSGANPSGPPTPRPPPTTTRAVARDAPELCPAVSVARTRRSSASRSGAHGCTARVLGSATATAGTASVATVISAGEPARLASSSSRPAQRCRTTWYPPSPSGSAETQFAAIGWPVSAPR